MQSRSDVPAILCVVIRLLLSDAPSVERDVIPIIVNVGASNVAKTTRASVGRGFSDTRLDCRRAARGSARKS